MALRSRAIWRSSTPARQATDPPPYEIFLHPKKADERMVAIWWLP